MNTQEQDAILAAEYVLGLLDTPTRRQLDKRLNDDEAFAKQVLRWQKAFSGMDALTPESAPSAEVWQRIARKVNHETHTPTPLRPAAWLGWSLAAALAAVLIFNMVTQPAPSPALQPIAILNGTQSDAQFVVSVDKSARTLQVSALNVALPQEKNLQLWLIKGREPPQAIGLITQPGHNEFRLAEDTLDNQTTLAVSLEPVGGSKLIGPSGPIVFVGKVRLSG